VVRKGSGITSVKDLQGKKVGLGNAGSGAFANCELFFKDAVESGFYEKYPYFTRIEIPAGTYKGVDKNAPSFQDSALWVANAGVPDEIVYDLLSKLYTEKGLAYMHGQKKTFKEMSLKTGIDGINRNLIPLHPGAARLWKEKKG